ncbi:flagellar basal-body rod protein FlgC [Pirellula staleyi DSM 6068]|uniref:Flagellar basal-body rod protein FlgC n=1 Tax=Pirellula staleyi (strain ATCC 27377 / DSM 6068 / ICPB 4128) TaxID=530564 RepID=D2R523_PIRSD|nr:flagellar basal body rod protein FlgC [Pirellula staleyi]ADB18985.1 flagellar basal-body rod protein FlgC [Pirellula staleyi DSM 6068]
MHTALDISTSALVAQRIRLDTISSNLANMTSLERDASGEMKPYEGKYVRFEADPELATRHGAVGVKVSSIETETVEPLYRWQPDHPYAIKEGPRKGYVAYPRINQTAEFVDALVATRAYEANVGVMEITKNMSQQTLRILG